MFTGLRTRTLGAAGVAGVACALAIAAPAFAVDGVVLIDQSRALAGGVTPGDGPGFPVTLTRPGSYRLAGNLIVSDPSAVAIRIVAPDVTLDLNGFEIAGPGQCDPGGGGACINTGAHGILSNATSAVTNGSIRGMNGHGVQCTSSCRIEGLLVVGNGGDGINAPLSLVNGNRAIGNGGWGLNLGLGAGYAHNLCSGNGLGAVSGGVAIGGNVCP